MGFSRDAQQKPWQCIHGMDAVLASWEHGSLARDFVWHTEREPRQAVLTNFPTSLASSVQHALQAKSIASLYAHQAKAIELAHTKTDFVVATPTASGKSLCYHLPVLNALADNSHARAMYLFPTKALSRDQEEAFRAMTREAGLHVGAVTYDGDTPADARRAAREKAGVLITNPDMLHAGILPHHTQWARLFADLRYVIVDELHTYRGVFGSHLANVLRRLRRVAHFHGADPVFIGASATIGNPGEHATRLFGRPVEVIDQNGAPDGARRVMVYNPPIVNAELGIRASYLKCAVRLTTDLIRAEVPTLVFGQSRNSVEVMLKYLRDRLRRDHIPEAAIQAYRGGYLPKTRRRIEAGLRAGDIRCVVATSALELGIDIGSLDAVVCAGYPGSMAGLWQRFGRAGRRQGRALAVLVSSSEPLDQFIARDAEQLIAAPIEQARIDANNVDILIQHLKCAAFELPFSEPFSQREAFGDLPSEELTDALGFLEDHGLLHQTQNIHGHATYHWANDVYPASHVSLRNIGGDNFAIIDLNTDKTMAELDWRSAHKMLHEQAIYQHDGEQHQVEKLDFENHKAYVRKVAPDYYTTAKLHTKVTVLEEDKSSVITLSDVSDVSEAVDLTAGLGDVSVIEKVVGYKKIKFHTHENLGFGDVYLPPMQMHTSAYWLTFPEDWVTAQSVSRASVIDAVRGISKAMHTVAIFGLMIDRRDLGRTIGSRHEPNNPPSKGTLDAGFDPTIFFYDTVAGGIGLAPRLFEEREPLLHGTYTLIQRCDCPQGCPACIGPENVSENMESLDRAQPSSFSRKALTLALLRQIGVSEIA